MGILERMSQKGRSSAEVTPSSTLALGEAPVVQRTRLVINYFTKSLAQGEDRNSKRVAFLLKKLTEDAIMEAQDVPPEIMELYMTQAAAVLYYAATGQVAPATPLPDDFPDVSDNPALAPVYMGELEA